MSIELDRLTPEERSDWEQFLKWYQDNGWAGEEARGLAWTDLLAKYERLRRLEDVPTGG